MRFFEILWRNLKCTAVGVIWLGIAIGVTVLLGEGALWILVNYGMPWFIGCVVVLGVLFVSVIDYIWYL